MVKILLAGADGQMGRVVTDIANASEDFEVVAGFSKEKHELDFPSYTKLESVKEDVDLLIDFSDPSSLEEILSFGLDNKVPLVLATTGYSEADYESIEKASKEIPIICSGNMSLGINLMEAITEKLAAALDGFDIEIVEAHHKLKKDSPSGTAKMLFKAANKGRNKSLHELDGRAGFYQGRDENEVGISSIRGGNIVGEHKVIFAGEDELIEITHRASSKKIFAIGALRAGEFLVNAQPGLYTMKDVL